MNILILEDEIPSYKKIMVYLSQIFEQGFDHIHVRSVEKARTVLLNENYFDLILSDIKLLDGTSFEIFNTISVEAPIIFCTAYDEHLLEAFKTNGIAYILKPFSLQELKEAIDKYHILFSYKPIEQHFFNKFKMLLNQETRKYRKRFAIKKTSGIQLLETADVCYIEAFGDICKLIDGDGNLHTISSNIGKIMLELDPRYFFRVNRSQIVNIKFIQKIVPYSKNRLSISIAGLNTSIITSSNVTKNFRTWLEQ